MGYPTERLFNSLDSQGAKVNISAGAQPVNGYYPPRRHPARVCELSSQGKMIGKPADLCAKPNPSLRSCGKNASCLLEWIRPHPLPCSQAPGYFMFKIASSMQSQPCTHNESSIASAGNCSSSRKRTMTRQGVSRTSNQTFAAGYIQTLALRPHSYVGILFRTGSRSQTHANWNNDT